MLHIAACALSFINAIISYFEKTRQDNRGQLGKGRNAKTACNSKMFGTDQRTKGPIDYDLKINTPNKCARGLLLRNLLYPHLVTHF